MATEFTGTYAGIPKLEKLDIRSELAEASLAYSDEDTFVAELHFLVDQILTDIGVDEVLTWLAQDLANLEYVNRYMREQIESNEKPRFAFSLEDPALDILNGALWVCMEDTIGSLYDEMTETGELPWQLPACFYCDATSKDLRGDRIGQPTCVSCWDEQVDGLWERAQDG